MNGTRDRDRDGEGHFSWDSWYRTLKAARLARARFMRSILASLAGDLKARICRRAQRWHIRFCPLCCQ